MEDGDALRRGRSTGAGREGLERDGDDAWRWSGANASGKETSLGTATLAGETLTVEVNSVERGARARERRAQKGWSDQRLRWIEPYWKGPDLAAVIEKAYRLKA